MIRLPRCRDDNMGPLGPQYTAAAPFVPARADRDRGTRGSQAMGLRRRSGFNRYDGGTTRARYIVVAYARLRGNAQQNALRLTYGCRG
jgi:hypothetical protein